MARRRKDAGPRALAPEKLVKLPPLSDKARQRLADALDCDDCDTAVAAIEDAILRLVNTLAAVTVGPRVREVEAHLLEFFEECLGPMGVKWLGMSYAERMVVFDIDPEFYPVMRNVAEGLRAHLECGEPHEDLRPRIIDRFFCRIINAVEAAGAHAVLPSRSYYDRAHQYPVFEVTRTAIEIALEHSKEHAPAAMLELQYLRSLADATLVDRLHAAHQGRKP